MNKLIVPMTGMLVATVHQASAAISVTSSTENWNAISYANPSLSDPARDQQTGGVEGDIIGNATHASLYTAFDNNGTPANLTDGEIGFRIRLGGDASPAGFKTVAWVGIDANADGKVDLFAGALEDAFIGFYRAGSSANTSPSTTSIDTTPPYHQVAVTAANFNFSAITSIYDPNSTTTIYDPTATNLNLDAGSGGAANHTDHFVSFKLSFASLVAAVNSMNLLNMGTFDENTPLRFIAATSNNDNTLNMDLNGINGGSNSTETWEALGGFTKTYSSAGVVVASVPEPSGAILVSATCILLGIRRKRSQA